MKIAAFATIALIAWIANANAQTTLHYASGLGAAEARAGAALGFDMADVGDVASLNALPRDVNVRSVRRQEASRAEGTTREDSVRGRVNIV